MTINEKVRQSTHDPGRDVTSIAALLFLIIAIRKAVRFGFLTICLHFERKQCDLTNNLLAARLMNRLRERCRRQALARRRRGQN